MICDDNEDILEVSSVILTMKGYEVKTITHSNDLFTAIDKSKPGIILMDLGIPEIGGAAATKQLKSTESTKNIPVLLFSANPDIAKIAIECGADGFLSKPFEIENLEKAIEQAI